MKLNRFKSLIAVLLFAALAAPASQAATFVVPSDGEMIDRAKLIVLARAVSSSSYLTGRGGIETETVFRIETPLKGDVAEGEVLRVTTNGGFVGTIGVISDSAPRFTIGEARLLFLEPHTEKQYRPVHELLGAFEIATASDGETRLLIRGSEEEEIFGWSTSGRPWVEQPRIADAFIDFIRARVSGSRVTADYFSTSDAIQRRTETNAGADYLTTYEIGGVTRGMRMPDFDSGSTITWFTSGTQPGLDGLSATTVGCAAWSNASGVSVRLVRGATNTKNKRAEPSDPSYGDRTVIFNDPSEEISGAFTGSGVLANAQQIFSSSTHTKNGETFWTIVHSDIVVQNGISSIGQTSFDTTMTHELGHTLGFRHSDESGRTPSNGSAIMNSQVVSGIGSTLQSWDIDAVQAVYGTGTPTCNNPVISTHPGSVTINAGSSTTLSVALSAGTSPTYAWYSGASGNTGSGVLGTSSSLTVSPSSTTSYWVRVTACGNSVDSNAATVTVSCTTTINQHPQSTSIVSGNSTTLSVSASGAPLSYQWYRGASGDTSSGVIGTTSSLQVSPTTTTSYWVRVTGCSGSVNSNAAVVTVTTCTTAISQHPQSTTINLGETATLGVEASGAPLSFAWYRGSSGDTSSGILGTGSIFFTAPTATTTYWVRVTGCSGSLNSNSATVTVNQPSCPAVTVSTPSSTPGTAGSFTLSASATGGSGFTYTWFRIVPGTGNVSVGTGSSLSVTPPVGTWQYFVRAQNSCGNSGDSATITLTGTCAAPSIAQPAGVTVTSSTTATLAVTATGGTTPYTYQWFLGAKNDTANPVGSSSTYTTAALTATTQYWVRVTSACGASVSSETITVHVLPGKRRATRR